MIYAPRARGRMAWQLIPCAVVALACAVAFFAGVRAVGAPLWVAIVGALVVFPLLPLGWHLGAERQRGRTGPGAPIDRLALRSLAIALLVQLISLGNLGPGRVGQTVAGLFHRGTSRGAGAPRAKPVAPPAAPGAAGRRPTLESFIPGDANLVVALSDAPAVQQFLAANGVETKKRLAAFEKCQIAVDKAQVLIATRDAGTRLVVVRAPGITDQRNLYCLVGYLGADKLTVRIASDKDPLRFEVDGLLGRPLVFQAVDAQTVVSGEGAWAETAPKKLFADDGSHAEGRLGPLLDRVNRTGSLWSAAMAHSEKGDWDLALDGRFDGTQLRLRGSSTPPSGAGDRAELELRVPLAFATALPPGTFDQGLRGAVSLLRAFAQAPVPVPAAPPRPPVGPPAPPPRAKK
jgi:hypothetical protein